MAIPDTISHKWVAVAVAPAVLPLVFFLSPIAYLEDYPVRTGLAACSEECPWSSACETQDTGGKTAGATVSAAYWPETATVTPACDGMVPTVTTTAALPAGRPLGTCALICITPCTMPGAPPA